MFILASYRFLEFLKIAKNASEHTIRSYAIDLNSFKSYLEYAWLGDINPEKLPERFRIEIPMPIVLRYLITNWIWPRLTVRPFEGF